MFVTRIKLEFDFEFEIPLKFNKKQKPYSLIDVHQTKLEMHRMESVETLMIIIDNRCNEHCNTILPYLLLRAPIR